MICIYNNKKCWIRKILDFDAVKVSFQLCSCPHWAKMWIFMTNWDLAHKHIINYIYCVIFTEELSKNKKKYFFIFFKKIEIFFTSLWHVVYLYDKISYRNLHKIAKSQVIAKFDLRLILGTFQWTNYNRCYINMV